LTYQSVNNKIENMSSRLALGPAAHQPASSRRRRKEQRPGEIIEAALEEFARRGFAATRLEDVAERAGVTKGTVYFYFKDKKDLFKAVARSALAPALGEMEALGANFEGSAEELLRVHLRAVYQKLVKTPRAGQILRLLIAEGPQFPELVDFYYRDFISAALTNLKRLIERGVARREFRRTRATDFPQVVGGPVVTAVIWNFLLAKQHPIDFDAYARTHVDLIINGLKAPKGK
jgi:AcrR family transcriptional regulator